METTFGTWTRRQGWLFVFVLVLGAAAGCAPSDSASTPDAQTLLATPPITPTGNVTIAQSTPIPTPQPTVFQTTTLVIWWPEPLAPTDNATLLDEGGVLFEQISAFDLSEGPSVTVDFRLKQPGDVGGILSTLQSASAVAPGAVPDVTLMRREDVLTAAALGLIQPLEDVVSPIIVGELYSVGLELGRVDGDLYGLPYTFDVALLAYLAQADEATLEATAFPEVGRRWGYDDILENDLTFAFAAARPTTISLTFLIQYLAAGGTVPTEGASVNAEALRSTLAFYEQLYNRRLLPPNILNYQSSADYFPELAAGTIDLGVISSTQYMRLRSQSAAINAAPVPTVNDEIVTLANGWMWVIPATTADRQQLAARFITWMMDIDRQRSYAEAVTMLPSQESALRGFDRSLGDFMLLDDLLRNAVPVPPENTTSPLMRAMQNALIAVLNGEMTADEAVADVLAQTSER
ncbi:MAG: extracellular solute-binding protein [bacterium]|nr:extracellular solute-binding protein [bacterium]